MVARNVFMKNFPVLSVKIGEGNLTISDVVGPDGGIIEDVIARAAEVRKGDLMKIKQHTVNGQILMEKAAAGDNIVVGIAVSEPMGTDNVTATGNPAAVAQMRVVDVALFGLGIIELTASATSAIAPGDIVGLDADEPNEVEVQTALASVTITEQGCMQALSYAAAGEKVSILVGAEFCVVN